MASKNGRSCSLVASLDVMPKKKPRRTRKTRPIDARIAALEEQIADLKAKRELGKAFSPAAVRKHRDRLGLSRADYAALCDVSPLTIYLWENGRTEPRLVQLERWTEVRRMGTARKRRAVGK